MQWNCTSFLTSNLRRDIILTVSDRWQDFLCPFGRKEPDVRKSSDRKIKHLSLY